MSTLYLVKFFNGFRQNQMAFIRIDNTVLTRIIRIEDVSEMNKQLMGIILPEIIKYVKALPNFIGQGMENITITDISVIFATVV